MKKRGCFTMALLLLALMIGLGPVQRTRAVDAFRPLLETGNEDGHADLVVGVPGEDWTSSDEGVVHIMYANGSGIPTGDAGDLWREGDNGLSGTMEMWDGFGTAVATGDFNGDYYTDLAIGIPGQSVGGNANAGAVHVVYASPDGLASAGNTVFTQDDLFATAEPNDAFGQEMVVGDFNGDGYDDLAVGVPSEDCQIAANHFIDAGAVNVIYGSATGLGSYNQLFDEYDFITKCEEGDQFGSALAAGDFDNDGYDDLAVGIPFEDFNALGSSVDDIGSVRIIFGTGSYLNDDDDSQVLFQGQGGLENVAEENDHFGRSLAAGYFNGDEYCDLAVGVPSEERGSYTDSGAVHVLYASASAFDPPLSDWLWDRYDTDVAGEIQDYAFFGRVLAAGDFDGDGIDDLAIGTPYDDVGGNADAGSVHVMYGGFSGGLSDWSDRVWYQGSYISTAVEANDRFGWSLAAGDVDSDGYDDLVIGTPYEHIGSVADAGMVQVFYGDDWGIPQNPRFQNLHQGVGSIPSIVEADDRFGSAVAVLHVTPRRVYVPLILRDGP